MRDGIDRVTGQRLSGWAHCVQSIAVILSTRVGTRIMRRDFGSSVRDLQDRNASQATVARVYVAVVEALRRWEPGYRVRTLQLLRGGRDGVFVFVFDGTFYPRGHLGDYSAQEVRAASVGLAADDQSIVFVRAA